MTVMASKDKEWKETFRYLWINMAKPNIYLSFYLEEITQGRTSGKI